MLKGVDLSRHFNDEIYTFDEENAQGVAFAHDDIWFLSSQERLFRYQIIGEPVAPKTFKMLGHIERKPLLNQIVTKGGIPGELETWRLWASTGNTGKLDKPLPYPSVLPPGKKPEDIVGIGIAKSDDHIYVWFRDCTCCSGSTDDLDCYRSLSDQTKCYYTLPPNKKPEDIVGMAIARDDHVYTWFRDKTCCSGTSKDLDCHRPLYPYSLPPNKKPEDIVGIGIAGSDDHVYAWFKDGTCCSGTSKDLDCHRSPYRYTLPSGIRPENVVDMDVASFYVPGGRLDTTFVWYNKSNYKPSLDDFDREYDHIGAITYFKDVSYDNNQGLLFTVIEGKRRQNHILLATSEDLEVVAWAGLGGQYKGAYCAINPANRILYVSDNNQECILHGFNVSTFYEQFLHKEKWGLPVKITRVPEQEIVLFEEDGIIEDKTKHLAGAVFADNLVWITRFIKESDEIADYSNYIHAYEWQTGKRIVKWGPYNFEGAYDEIEGIAYHPSGVLYVAVCLNRYKAEDIFCIQRFGFGVRRGGGGEKQTGVPKEQN